MSANDSEMEVAERNEVDQPAPPTGLQPENAIWEFQDYGNWWCAMPPLYQDALNTAWTEGHLEAESKPADLWHTHDKYKWDIENMTQHRIRAGRDVKIRKIRRVIISSRVPTTE